MTGALKSTNSVCTSGVVDRTIVTSGYTFVNVVTGDAVTFIAVGACAFEGAAGVATNSVRVAIIVSFEFGAFIDVYAIVARATPTTVAET